MKTKVLLSDIVGFVIRLPTYRIDAFKSTLEESLTADLILLFTKSSEALQDIKIRYSSSWQVLDDLKVYRAKVFVVLTKYDSYTDAQKIDENAKELHLESPLVVPSNTGYGVHKLKTIIKQYSMPRK
jgi:GTP-binding protein HflX